MVLTYGVTPINPFLDTTTTGYHNDIDDFDYKWQPTTFKTLITDKVDNERTRQQWKLVSVDIFALSHRDSLAHSLPP